MLFFIHLTARAQLAPEPETVRIGVLSLFHPDTLILTPDQPATLLLDGAPHILDAHRPAILHAAQTGFSVKLTEPEIPAQNLSLVSGSFTLTVPGKLTRTYRGALTVSTHAHILVPVIAMETELAVASIVAAEAPPHAPLEALKAQAVASRSFLLARRNSHVAFDSCDTTHCQFLRSPPAASSPAAIATRATRNTVLTWRSSPDALPRIVAAMYSRSCGGQTRVPPASADSYPFYSVRCSYCLRHTELWSRAADTPATASEQDRLAYNRTHGWSAIPSNNHMQSASSLDGRGIGHGIGLCQLGASGLAAHGATFAAILSLYFPNTTLSTLP